MIDIIDNAVMTIMPLALFFLMLTLGLKLTVKNFTDIIRMPRSFAVGMLNQMFILPLVTFIVVILFGLEPILAAGLVLAALCPGGTTTSYVSKLAKGDVALSILLTAIMSMLIVITIPIALKFVMPYFMGGEAPSFSIVALGIKMAAITAVPVSIGMTIHRFLPTFTVKIRPVIDKVAIGVFILSLVLSIRSVWTPFVDNLGIVGIPSVLIIAIMFYIGYKSPYWFGLEEPQARTVAIEAPYQNPIIAFTTAGIVYPSVTGGLSPFAAPAAVYAILALGVYVVVYFLWIRK